MPPPSLARTFFDQIRNAADPVQFIRNLYDPASPMPESDWLDFKQPPRSGPAQQADLKDGQWQKIWMEALTGFANNQGGVLLWGIDARKDKPSEIEAAIGEVPVLNPKAVKSRLVELQRQATDPPLANVEIETYTLPAAADRGFVVCYVPEGTFKPYREASGRSQYIYRVADNFTVMPRSMLQSLFYPRSKAVFLAKAQLSWEYVDKKGTAAEEFVRMYCTVELVNDGTATARNTEVLVETNAKDVRGPLQFNPGNLWGRYGGPPDVDFRLGNPIHPGRAMGLFSLDWLVAAHPRRSDHRVVPWCDAPSFSLVIYCENQEQQVIKIEFDVDELIEKRECVREGKAAE